MYKGEGRQEVISKDGWTVQGMISDKKGLSEEEVYARATWRHILSSYIDPT